MAGTSTVLVGTDFTECVRVTAIGERGSGMLSGADGALRNQAAAVVLGLLVAAVTTAGCNSILNSWLDPTTLGNYNRTSTNEIRSSLTLGDTPTGIPGAVPPSMEDLRMVVVEYPISAGDTLAVEINELRQRQVAFQVQVQVALAGYVNLPVVGRVPAAGLTVPQFEEGLVEALRERNVLLDPEVTVNPLFLQKATYSIFGVGVSASSNSPLRAGTFPIRHTDLRLLEAINQVGGLNEFVTEVYVFRNEEPLPPPARLSPGAPGSGDAGARKHLAPTLKGVGAAGLESRTSSVPPRSGVNDEDNDRVGALKSPETVTSGAREHLAPTLKDVGAAGLESRTSSGSATAKQELLDALAPAPKGQAPPGKKDDIPESLEPDPTQPYIYVNNEFVPNPTYVGARREIASAPSEIPPFDTAAPAANWSRIAGETSFRVLLIPAEALRSGDLEANIFIRAGDVIRISTGEVGVYYVMGQVGRVGTFRFEAEQITLKAAIAAAGGLSNLAWPDRCTVYRRLGQREQMIQVNLDRIFAGLDPDFTIKRGDIINVGTHPFAPFLERIRALTLPNPVNNVGYSFTYARNFADVDSFTAKQNPADKPGRFENLFP